VLEVAFAVPNFAGQIAFLRVLAPNFDEPAQAKSLVFGIYLVYQIGFVDGLFR